jgi:tryptophan-rich sensory protein
MRRVAPLIFSLALAYGAAWVGSLFTTDAIAGWYTSLVKSELNPPNWVFGPVWTVLYACMAVAAWRVYKKRKIHPSVSKSLVLYVVQLALNVAWSVAFFGFHAPLFALGIIGALLICIAALELFFSRIDWLAGLLFLPYLAWVLFAAYLNLMIVLLN